MSVPSSVSAQTFVDLFAGRSLPERTAATITAEEAQINGTIVPAQLRVDVASLKPMNSTIFGVRAGHWFNWFGVAIDAATLSPDVKRQTVRATANLRFDEQVFGEQVTIDPGQSVSVTIPRITVPTTATIAALAMVRVPLARVQPYIFAGPAYLITDSDISGYLGCGQALAGEFRSPIPSAYSANIGTRALATRARSPVRLLARHGKSPAQQAIFKSASTFEIIAWLAG